MHPYDRYFYNETLGEYTVGTYLADLEARRVYVIVIVIVVVIVIVRGVCLPVHVPVPVCGAGAGASAGAHRCTWN